MNKFYELLFLKQLKGVGNSTINRKYISQMKDINGIEECIKLVKQYETKLTSFDIERARRNAEEKYKALIDLLDIEIITLFDEKYPKQLMDLKDKKPVILYVKGNQSLLKQKSIAVVGTRKPSVWSKKVEQKLINKITSISDMVIVSGLALGCDRIAHETTVQVKAKTIAVLPSGVNIITPSSNKKLAQDILDNGGCLVSEYEPNAKVTKSTYVERDAVIAALTKATMVIECGEKSGTMHTVNAAESMRRDLACYYIEDPSKGQYKGNEFIIKMKGATKVSDTEELTEFLDAIGKEPEESGIYGEQMTLFDMNEYVASK